MLEAGEHIGILDVWRFATLKGVFRKAVVFEPEAGRGDGLCVANRDCNLGANGGNDDTERGGRDIIDDVEDAEDGDAEDGDIGDVPLLLSSDEYL